MSSCVVIQNKSNLIFASDTALSAYVDGNFYRVNSEYHKIHSYDDGWYFFCGKESVFNLVNQRIKEYGFDEIESWLRRIIGINPGCLYDAEIIRMDKNTNIVYQYSQYNDFECVVHHPPDTGFNIITSGYKTKELFYLISSGMKVSLDIFNIIVDSYHKIADACVGGSIDININGQQENYKLIEKINNSFYDANQYLANTDFVESGHISGSDIIGSQIGIGRYIDGKYAFQVDSNGNLYSRDGIFAGLVKASSIESTSLETSDGTFSVDKNGYMTCTNAEIGGWKIGSSDISGNNITLFSNGKIDGSSWYISSSGGAHFESCNLAIKESSTEIRDNQYSSGQLLNNYIDGQIVSNLTVRGELNANEGQIQSIENYETNLTTLRLTRGTWNDVNVDGIINAAKLKVQNLTAISIDASQITTGSLTIDKLDMSVVDEKIKDYIRTASLTSTTAKAQRFYTTKINGGQFIIYNNRSLLSWS